MANDLVRILEERLPQRYESDEQKVTLRRLGSDVTELRNTFDEYVDDHSYSNSNSQGPIEVSIDSDELEKALDKVSNTMKEGYSGLSESIGESNELLQAMYDEQSELTDIASDMADSLETANKINASNLAVNVLGLGVAKKTLEEIAQLNDEFEELDYDIKYLQQTADEIVTELEVANSSLQEIADNQKDSIAIQRRTNQWLRRTNDQIKILEETLASCFLGISKQQEQISSQIITTNNFLAELVKGQERMRRDIVNTMTSLAKNSSSIRADEKYSFAYEQYKIGNYTVAIKDLKVALKERSTHLPSMLLLGAISIQYALWSNAKDTYYRAAQLAKSSKDIKSYHSAMIGLANIEFLVQNLDTAKKIIDEAAEFSYSLELDKAYLKMRARTLK